MKLSTAMEDALASAYQSTWRPGTLVIGPGHRWQTIKAMRKRGLCRGDGELTSAGEAERQRILKERD